MLKMNCMVIQRHVESWNLTLRNRAEDELRSDIRTTEAVDGNHLQLIEGIWHEVLEPVESHWPVTVLRYDVPCPVYQRLGEVVRPFSHQNLQTFDRFSYSDVNECVLLLYLTRPFVQQD